MEDYLRIFCNYFEKIALEEAKKDHQSRIIEEIARQKEVENEINEKLTWFASLDWQVGRNLGEIKNLKRWVDKNIYPWPTPIDSVRITNGFFRLYGKDVYRKDVEIHVRPDRKRCQKNLIKKGVMDVEYLEQVQEELMISKKSSGVTGSLQHNLFAKKSSGMTPCGTRQLNDLVESLGHRIQHGNDTRANEKKIYQEIKTVNETRELYSAPEPPSHYGRSNPRLKDGDVKGDKDWKLSKQHQINICLGDIERLKTHLKGRKCKVTRLKENLELVRKKISSLTKELENVTSKGNEAYKRTDKLGDQRILTYAEKLAQKGVEGLKQLCMRDTQVEIFVRRWCRNKGFKNDFKIRKLSLWTITRQGKNDYETRKLALKRQ